MSLLLARSSVSLCFNTETRLLHLVGQTTAIAILADVDGSLYTHVVARGTRAAWAGWKGTWQAELQVCCWELWPEQAGADEDGEVVQVRL